MQIQGDFKHLHTHSRLTLEKTSKYTLPVVALNSHVDAAEGSDSDTCTSSITLEGASGADVAVDGERVPTRT